MEFRMFDSVLYVIWKQLKSGVGIPPPGTLLMAESRPDFLKGPLLVSLQNSGAYGFVSMQFTTLDFPAESKKSSPCRTEETKTTTLI